MAGEPFSPAQKLVFLGSPAEGLPLQSHQELTLGWGEGFLGRAENYRERYVNRRPVAEYDFAGRGGTS